MIAAVYWQRESWRFFLGNFYSLTVRGWVFSYRCFITRGNQPPTGKLQKAPILITLPSQSPAIPPTEKPLNMSTPKVAIIIYSLYGHIAKRSLDCSLNIICPYSFFSCYRYPVAEAEKAGIESAGGKVDIYQYDSIPSPKYQLSYSVYLGPEWPKPFLKRSSPRCTLQRNPITPSLPQKS